LSGLSNTDKHRNIALVQPKTGLLRIDPLEHIPKGVLGMARWEDAQEGQIGARVPLLGDREVKFKAYLGGHIAFGETAAASKGMPVGLSVFVTLVKIGVVLRDRVLPELEAFF
jgi:hypothetical protein